MRAGVAAVVNASHPNINYPRSPAAVIADVNAVICSGDRQAILALASRLDADNNLGCPLSARGSADAGAPQEARVAALFEVFDPISYPLAALGVVYLFNKAFASG